MFKTYTGKTSKTSSSLVEAKGILEVWEKGIYASHTK